jgi:hypothetical protein
VSYFVDPPMEQLSELNRYALIALRRYTNARLTKVPADFMSACDALRTAELHARAALENIERTRLNPRTADTAETVRVQENIPYPDNGSV